MKYALIISLVLLFGSCNEKNTENASTLTNTENAASNINTPTIKEFVPDSVQIRDSISLDLNGDSINDYVLVLEDTTLRESSKNNNPDGIHYPSYYPKSLLILWGQKNGPYKLALRTSTIFGDYDWGIQTNDAYRKLTKRGKTFALLFTTGGSSGRDDYNYVFQYRDNDFYLVGKDEWEYELPLDNNGSSSSTNLITGQVEEYKLRDGKRKNYSRSTVMKKPLVKLSDFNSEPKD